MASAANRETQIPEKKTADVSRTRNQTVLTGTESSFISVESPDTGAIMKTKLDDETQPEATGIKPIVKIKIESDPRVTQTLDVLFANFDQTVDIECVKMFLERAESKYQRLKFKLTKVENCFVQDMEQKVVELNEKYRKGQKYHFAIFAVHAYESRLNINEKTAGIGYFAFYEALKQITGDRVIILFGGDVSNEEKVISSVVMSKMCTQFLPEYINGNKGLLMSWNNHSLELHCYALFRFLRLVDLCIIDVSGTDWNAISLFDVKDEDSNHFDCIFCKLDYDKDFSLLDKATIMKAFSSHTDTLVINPLMLIAVDAETIDQQKTEENIASLLQMFSDKHYSVVVVYGDKMEAGDNLSSKKSRLYVDTILKKTDLAQTPLTLSWNTAPSDEQRNALKNWFFELDPTRLIVSKSTKDVDNKVFPRQIETESVISNASFNSVPQSITEDGNLEADKSLSQPNITSNNTASSDDDVIKNLLIYEEHLKEQKSLLSVVCAFVFCTEQGELIGDAIDKPSASEKYIPGKYEKDIAKKHALKSRKKGKICIVLLKEQEDDETSCVILEEELETLGRNRKKCILM